MTSLFHNLSQTEFVPRYQHLCLITAAALLTGCSASRQAVQPVREVQKDTIYLNHVQYDSIYVQNDHSQEYHPFKQKQPTSKDLKLSETLKPSETAKGMKPSETLKPSEIVDTIYIRDVSTQYRYKLLRDTTYIHHTDTIPVIREVEVVKTERYTPWPYRASLVIVIVMVIVLIAYVLWKIKS